MLAAVTDLFTHAVRLRGSCRRSRQTVVPAWLSRRTFHLAVCFLTLMCVVVFLKLAPLSMVFSAPRPVGGHGGGCVLQPGDVDGPYEHLGDRQGVPYPRICLLLLRQFLAGFLALTLPTPLLPSSFLYMSAHANTCMLDPDPLPIRLPCLSYLVI
jgi:hypothetical protein